MMVQSSTQKKRGKADIKPKKPYKDFPLMFHASGRLAKKIRQKFYYFGRWATVQSGKLTPVDNLDDSLDKAVKLYNLQRDDLYAGRKPRNPDDDGTTVGKLCFEFLASRMTRLDAGELSTRSYRDYDLVGEKIIAEFGKDRLLSDLRPDDFRKFRESLAKGRGPVSLANDITRVRVFFKFGYDSGLIEAPIRFGPDFARPTAKTLRISRAKNGPRMFEGSELRLILNALSGQEVTAIRIDKKTGKPAKIKVNANPQLRAMVLLAANCAYGQTDVANLPLSAVDLKSGWINYPRPKTGIERRCPLWQETVAAVRDVIAARTIAKRTEDEGLLFLTKRHGLRWVRPGKSSKSWIDSVAMEYNKLLTALGIKRPRLGYYAIRHTFQTIGERAKDPVAVSHIMGHADTSMASTYRERIDDDRLQAVTEYVRAWLFSQTGKRDAK